MALSNQVLQTGRVALGAALWIAPQAAGKVWLSDSANTKVALRALGIRDIALGVATLRAENNDPANYRALLALGVAADLTDCLATLSNRSAPSKISKMLIAALAGGAAAGGALLIKESLSPDPLLIP